MQHYEFSLAPEEAWRVFNWCSKNNVSVGAFIATSFTVLLKRYQDGTITSQFLATPSPLFGGESATEESEITLSLAFASRVSPALLTQFSLMRPLDTTTTASALDTSQPPALTSHNSHHPSVSLSLSPAADLPLAALASQLQASVQASLDIESVDSTEHLHSLDPLATQFRACLLSLPLSSLESEKEMKTSSHFPVWQLSHHSQLGGELVKNKAYALDSTDFCLLLAVFARLGFCKRRVHVCHKTSIFDSSHNYALFALLLSAIDFDFDFDDFDFSLCLNSIF